MPAQGLSQKIAVSPADPNTVFLARNESNGSDRTYPMFDPVSGFYRSTDGGANWTRPIIGQVRDFVQSPNNANVIYATVLDSHQAEAAPAGIYKSTDAGVTFTAITNAPTLAGAEDFRVAISLADNASLPQQRVFYYGGTSAAPQILVQFDNGTTSTWTTIFPTKPQLDSGQFGYNTYFAVDPLIAGRLYVGSRDIFRLTIDGTNALTSSTNITNVWTYFGHITGLFGITLPTVPNRTPINRLSVSAQPRI